MSLNGETAKREPASRPSPRDAGSFIARLQTLVRHWPSADRLARATGVSPSAFRKWLRGEAEPSRERLVALAHAAGVSVGWLAGGEGPEPHLRSPSGPPAPSAGGARFDRQGYLLLPKRPEAAAAGGESPTPPRGTEFMALSHDWVRATLGIEPDHLILETAVGESMLPSIQDGDLLLIDASAKRFHGFGVYVLEIGGERLVKRVQSKLDGSVTLISDNPAYEPDHVARTQAADIHVVGRVLWTCGPTRGAR